MARKVKDAGDKSSKTISKSVFDTLVSRATAIRAEIQESTGELGSFVKNAEEKHGINRKAFALSVQLSRMEATKLADFLRSFDLYRGYAGLDKIAGKDLFADAGEGAEKTEAGDDDAGEQQTADNVTRLKSGIKPIPADVH